MGEMTGYSARSFTLSRAIAIRAYSFISGVLGLNVLLFCVGVWLECRYLAVKKLVGMGLFF